MVTISNWIPKDDREYPNAKRYAPHIRVCIASSPVKHVHALPFRVRVYVNREQILSHFNSLRVLYDGWFDDLKGGRFLGSGAFPERRCARAGVDLFETSFSERGILGLTQIMLLDGTSHLWWLQFPSGYGEQIVDRVRRNYTQICTKSLQCLFPVLIKIVMGYLFGDKVKLTSQN